MIFLPRVFSNVFSNRWPYKRHSHIGCIYTIFLQSVFLNGFSNRYLNRGIVALVTFVGFFSRVYFQMSSQMPGMNKYKVTYHAFVHFLSSLSRSYTFAWISRRGVHCGDSCLSVLLLSVTFSYFLLCLSWTFPFFYPNQRFLFCRT